MGQNSSTSSDGVIAWTKFGFASLGWTLALIETIATAGIGAPALVAATLGLIAPLKGAIEQGDIDDAAYYAAQRAQQEEAAKTTQNTEAVTDAPTGGAAAALPGLEQSVVANTTQSVGGATIAASLPIIANPYGLPEDLYYELAKVGPLMSPAALEQGERIRDLRNREAREERAWKHSEDQNSYLSTGQRKTGINDPSALLFSTHPVAAAYKEAAAPSLLSQHILRQWSLNNSLQAGGV